MARKKSILEELILKGQNKKYNLHRRKIFKAFKIKKQIYKI